MLTGYPGSTRKPGSANIIRTRKQHKEQKSAPETAPGTPARSTHHPSPGTGADGTRTPGQDARSREKMAAHPEEPSFSHSLCSPLNSTS
jgi:hypothetical protein